MKYFKEGLTKFKNKFSDLQAEAQDFTLSFHRRTLATAGRNSLAYFQRLNFDQIITEMMSTRHRARMHRYFIYLLFAIGSYSLGKIIALTMAKLVEVPQSMRRTPHFTSSNSEMTQELAQIKNANLFNSYSQQQDVVNQKKNTSQANLICHEASIISSLPIKLSNSIVLQNQGKSLVMLEVAGEKTPLSLREKEVVNNLAEIGRIERQRVIIKNLRSNTCEYLEKLEPKMSSLGAKARSNILSPTAGQILMDSKIPSGIKNEGNNFTIPKKTRDEMLANISDVLQQAKATPFKNPDGSLSFKITDVVPGSIYSQLNIKNDDIITKINGKKIQDVMEVMNMFGSIKDIDNLSITVGRSGVEETQEFNFE